ncbi:NAD(P)-dependent dehydrogenase (short-subunit alcohol dehydrogenase family) [Knoellia remsis]|jgi:NAD(P)-dependent dehydrogenase (short-subunit alcohol dehydrogenase family)|uniref:NAD(P)-dependent dehydrogenase (Short-subunit alcohol dehydrogenase family) n=1 Tax=Knoellia remsis TaxID=407159 RepID=A0A2T0UYH0_9MICO|nr:glucose 1-dehydrogenase [Knoellia remsis]PRY62934.1 NAD(P)-dependent dehydrogenase (short-subunit alcohol dehydrogenase family) [Knoellia remsis]
MSILDTFSLSGRTALVTGGYKGIGLALARGLAEAGADVVIGARDGEASEEVARQIAEETGRTVVGTRLDVTDAQSCVAAVEVALGRTGRFDILVNNAGACIHAPALEVTDEDWDAVMDVNVGGLWKMSRAAGTHFAEAGSGTIVNIGSMSGGIVNRPQWQPAYNASKAAVHHLTKSLAAEWAPLGIRVNAVAPGYVKTEMAPVDDPAFRARWIDDAPMQRFAMPEEIAPAVVFLASDASSFMTGSVVTIDGGYSVF